MLEHVLGQSLRRVDDRERYWITPAGRLALLEAECGGRGMNRCRVAISLGWHPDLSVTPEHAPGIHTRCIGAADDGHTQHEGVGLPQFAAYQRFHWFTRDRRVYETDRNDTEAWEL